MSLGRQPPRLDRVGEDHRRAVFDLVGLAKRARAGRPGRARRDRAARRRASRRRARARSARCRAVRGPRRAAARAAARRELRSSRWYSSLGIGSIRARSASPPRSSNSSRRRRPYLTVIVCQPAASNIAPTRPAAMSGTTRSSDWRLRSTIHSTSPRRGTIGSTSASQIAPSSSSASPTQRDLATAARHLEVAGDVAVRERAPDRRGRADADRAGREVDRVGVLRAARIALQPAERAQLGQVGLDRACRAGS